MRKEEAIEYFGGDPHALAKAIGVTIHAIKKWGDVVPKCRRTAVRLAMRERANELEKQAARLRLESWSDE